MSNFTPGPWELEETEDGHVIRMGKAIEDPNEFPSHMEIEYNHGCLLDGEDGDVFSELEIMQAKEARANAHLIAAAPEMYEALEECVNYLKFFADCSPQMFEGFGIDPHGMLNNAKYALLKAQGGQSCNSD